MAVTAKIFLLFIGAVIVKSHHIHHFNRPYHHHHHHHHQNHPDAYEILDNIIHSGIFGGGLFGSDNMHGNGDSVQDGHVDTVYPDDMGQEENHAPFDIGTGYHDNDQELDIGAYHPDQNNVMIGQPNESNPDDNLNLDVAKDPQIADDHNSNSHEPEAPTVTVEIKPDTEFETNDQGNQADNNQPHINIATDKVPGQKINTGSGLNLDVGNVFLSGLNQQKNPEEINNDSINHKVPGYLDEDIKKGILMVDPELKYNINEGHKPIVPDMNVANESISQNNPSITTENVDDLVGYGKKDSRRRRRREEEEEED